jgi:hypothetical protein
MPVVRGRRTWSEATVTTEAPARQAGSWAIPRRTLLVGSLVTLAMLVPTGLAYAFAGPDAALPLMMAILMCIGAAAKLPPRYSLELVALVAATAAISVAMNGQPFVAACFAVLVCLLVAPANTIDSGLMGSVPPTAAVYLAATSMTFKPEATALWTVVGGLFVVVLMTRFRKPAQLKPITARVAYRHAGVMAGAMGLAIWAVLYFDVPHGYWVPMTMGIVLQPYASETLVKARQRIVGTIVGGILAVALAFVLPAPAILVALLPLTILTTAYALLGRYGHAVVFLTPTAVLLANLASQDDEITATIQRILATLAGGLIAGALALLLSGSDSPSAVGDQPATQPASPSAQEPG